MPQPLSALQRPVTAGDSRTCTAAVAVADKRKSPAVEPHLRGSVCIGCLLDGWLGLLLDRVRRFDGLGHLLNGFGAIGLFDDIVVGFHSISPLFVICTALSDTILPNSC